MHPVIAKLKPVIAKFRENRSHRIDCVNINPADAHELELDRPGSLLFGVPVIVDPTRPRYSAMIGTTQERDAFDDEHHRR